MKYSENIGFKTLAARYAANIANGRFLWRNRIGLEKIEVRVSHIVNEEVAMNGSLMRAGIRFEILMRTRKIHLHWQKSFVRALREKNSLFRYKGVCVYRSVDRRSSVTGTGSGQPK